MNHFDNWLYEHIQTEIAEIGGMTDREAEEFHESRETDAEYVEKMRKIYNRERGLAA